MPMSLTRTWIYLVAVLLVLGLSGCDSPSPAFSGLNPVRVTVDGSTFSVRHTPFAAEAIRLNPEANPTRGGTVFKGAKAMVLASGCAVVTDTLDGDEAVVRADLDCAGAGPRPARDARPLELDCGIIGPGKDYAEIESIVTR